MSEVTEVEYLYGTYSYVPDDGPAVTIERQFRFPIVKKTAKRIYYQRPYDRGTGFVDRQKLEADGEVINRGRHYFEPDYRLYVEPPAPREHPKVPTLAELKADMVRLHPDVGGSHQEFLAARARYERAGGRL